MAPGPWSETSTEIEALMRVFPLAKIRPQSIPLGSIKSMVGHPKHARELSPLLKPPWRSITKFFPYERDRQADPSFSLIAFYPNVRARPWIHSSVKHPGARSGSALSDSRGQLSYGFWKEDQNPGPVSAPCMGRPCELFVFAESQLKALHCRLNALKERSLIRRAACFPSRKKFGMKTGPVRVDMTILADSVEDLGAKLEKSLKECRLKPGAGNRPDRKVFGSFPPLCGRKSGALAFYFPDKVPQYTACSPNWRFTLQKSGRRRGR